MVIPTSTAGMATHGEAVAGYYQTIFQSMRDALRGGTAESLAELRYLLSLHKRDGIVPFAREQMERFELLAEGLEFELSIRERCELEPVVPGQFAQATQKFRFRMRGFPDQRELRLGGSHTEGVGFQVVIEARDVYADGQALETTHNLVLPIEEDHRLVRGQELIREFEVPPATPRTALRTLHLRVEILPGVVFIDGRRLPVSQLGRSVQRAAPRWQDQGSSRARVDSPKMRFALCAELRTTLYPEGADKIQAKPLETLRLAIRRGAPKWFRHAYLAVHFLPPEDRDAATARLISWLRTGTRDQQQVAMGCLRLLVPTETKRLDRAGWLVWWDRRPTTK